MQTVEYDPELRRWYVRFGCDGRDAATIYFDLHQRTLRYEVYFLPDPPRAPRSSSTGSCCSATTRCTARTSRSAPTATVPRRVASLLEHLDVERARPHHRRALRARRALVPAASCSSRFGAGDRVPELVGDVCDGLTLDSSVYGRVSRRQTGDQLASGPRCRRAVPFGEVRGGPSVPRARPRRRTLSVRRYAHAARSRPRLPCPDAACRVARRRADGRGPPRSACSTPAGTPDALAVAEVDADRRRDARAAASRRCASCRAPRGRSPTPTSSSSR